MAAKIEQPTVLSSSKESASTLSPVVAAEPARVTQFQLDADKLRLAAAVTLSASVALIILGLAVLSGWAAGVTFLTRLETNLVSMRPNAAVCFTMAGVALLCLRREGVSGWPLRLGQACSAVVILIGGLTVLEFLIGTDLHIDQLLFPAATAF